MVLTDLASKTETVDNRSFQFSYVYNSKGQLETTTYPDSKSIKYEYANGDLYKIIWQPDETTVWQKNDENAKGQVLTTTLGNGVQGTYAYNTIGVPTSIKAAKGTASLLNIGYQNIDARGNIKNRNEQTTSQSENFTYDSMNRLTTGVEYGERMEIVCLKLMPELISMRLPIRMPLAVFPLLLMTCCLNWICL